MALKTQQKRIKMYWDPVENVLYYLERVSKAFCGQYTMGNAAVTTFQDFGANVEALREPAL